MTRQPGLNRHRFRLPRRVRGDVDDEIAFHLEMRIREFVDGGMTLEEARAAAEERFGSQVTLALGLGGVTAIYSVLNAVVLAPLPYPAPDRLVRLQEVKRGESPWAGISLPDLLDWRERARSFERIGVVQTGTGVNLSDGDETEHVTAALVSDDLFAVLGTRALLGRPFDASDHAPGAAPAVVLSHELWQRRFGGDSSIVGRPITINGRPIAVRGIMPAGFHFPDASVKLWLPLPMARGVGYITPNGRWARLFAAYGRLAPGVSLEQAQRELSAVAAQLERENPAQNASLGAAVTPLGKWMVASVDRILWILFGAAGVVLLIACVNVSNLTLVRATTRARDIAVRLAHGATTRHLLRQFLAESTVLALAAATLGTALACGVVRAFVVAPPAALPRLEEVRIQGAALGIATAIAIGTALALGLASAWLYSRPDMITGVMGGGARSTETRGRRRARSVFVVGEVALSVVLLASAALLGVSYVRLTSVDPGFRGEGVTSMVLHPRGATYRASPAAITQLYDRVLSGVRAIPGVSAAAPVDGPPLTGGGTGWTLVPDGEAITAGQDPSASVHVVSEDYFRALGIPLHRGRAIERTDLGEARVAVVNDAAVASIFGGRNPVGRRVALGSVGSRNPPLTIVGVVGDVHDASLALAAEPQVYVPYAPATLAGDMTLVVRSSGAPSGVVSRVREVMRRTDAGVALSDIASMEAIVSASVAGQRVTATLIAAFAALALLMAALGIFGVLAQSVAQDARGLAIRVALGARPAWLVRAVTARGLALTAAGVAVGLAATIGTTGLLSNLLFGVSRTDPVVLGGVVVLFLVVATLACALPALRATRADPVRALRGD